MLKATILLTTLKSSPEVSHTEILCKLLIEKLEKHDTETEIIRTVDHMIKPGTKEDMGTGDQWPAIRKKILASDIIIFATPTWWGTHSSQMQMVMERMNEIRTSDFRESGKSPLNNKVAGIVVTGAEDGAEYIIARLCQFATWIGLSMPPACSLSVIASENYSEEDEDKIMKLYKKDYDALAGITANNLTSLANLLKAQPKSFFTIKS